MTRMQHGALYNTTHGYGEREVKGWEGRTIYGVAIGIIQLEVNIPMPPGDMGNASTFNFPVMYRGLGEVDPMWVVSSEPHPEILKRTIEAGKWLENQGARAVLGNCGFFANYQPQVAAELNVQFFSSSLLQVPMVMSTLSPNQKVGVLTADGSKLKEAPALEYCGVADLDRVVIYGNENGKEMQNVLQTTGRLNIKALEDELVELAKTMVAENPDVGAIVLECSEFPMLAHAIQDAVHLNVWGFTTLVDWIQSGAVCRRFTGFM